MTTLKKYNDTKFVLPAVVDFINYEHHAVIDIIQVKGELFKRGDQIDYNQQLEVIKVVKKYPIQTELKIENRLDILKVRYFCNKIKTQ